MRNLWMLVLVLVTSASVVMAQDFARRQVEVPKADSGAITIDGVMDEAAWSTAGEINMITSSGFDIFANKYYREDLVEPDYDEMYARLLWSKDTLFVFMHIDEFVNDTTDLYWNGQWTGDQLFISLSNRLGVDMMGWYDGNVYAAPDGPYHFLILGEDVTLNNGQETYIPEEYWRFPDDTVRVFEASDIARWGVTIDKATGVWNVEMAIYQPHVNADSRIGFNIGGSTGSTYDDTTSTHDPDAYGYYTWQPNVPDFPWDQPQGVPIPPWGGGDPGFYNLANADCWGLLTFVPSSVTGIEDGDGALGVPSAFSLEQNYPNPFNPATTVSYSVPSAARVTLTVHNVLGQQVATLVDGMSAAGRFAVRWDATNVASGIYFVQLRANNAIVSTRKMMLLK